jgi:hypothetical protein
MRARWCPADRHDTRYLDVGFLEERLQPVVELHALRVIWYLRRITVRHSRCSASGTKLEVSSCATKRFTRRSASGKSRLRPPALDSIALVQDAACRSSGSHLARPALRFQYRSSASHTVANTARSIPSRLPRPRARRASQQARAIGRAGPDLQSFEVDVTLDLDVGHRDGQHLLVHVDSRDLVRHRPLLVGAESVPRRINQGRELSPRATRGDAQLFGQSRTLRVKQLLGLDCSMANLDLAAPSAAILPKL